MHQEGYKSETVQTSYEQDKYYDCPSYMPTYNTDMHKQTSLYYDLPKTLGAYVCATPHKNLESLKAAMVKAWDEIPLETLRAAVDDVPKRLKACIKAKGGYFEI
uniref:DDE-1 domain-containing protein n=1 Tax=Acrobeloides nanus TaxID=290746 RepID=A0A914DHV7_9BILA